MWTRNLVPGLSGGTVYINDKPFDVLSDVTECHTATTSTKDAPIMRIKGDSLAKFSGTIVDAQLLEEVLLTPIVNILNKRVRHLCKYGHGRTRKKNIHRAIKTINKVLEEK